MSEPQDARRWFPCYDEPWDKATSDIYVTLPETCRVGSNGILTESWNDPGSGTMTYHWVNNYQIATYLINLIMGNYATWTDYYISPSGDSLPIFNMCWREDSAAAAYDFAIVPNMIGIYSRLFYPYPFEKYGQGVVAPFAYGGMENQTMTTFNRSWITGDRLYEFGYAHELAHMWWGDFVTLADWRHIWLNEGFATYSSALYTEDNYGLDAFAANMLDYQDAYFAYDRDIGRYPIYNPSDLFGAPVYVKGAWILHMLRGLMGDQQFFSGLHQYAAQYAYANASTGEFRSVMEGVSGLNLQRFFDQWVFDQGFPEYTYTWTYEAAGDSFLVHLEIDQNQSNAPIFEMPLRVKVHSTFDYDFTFDNNQALQTYDFLVPTAPINIILDPDNWVLKKVLQGDNLNEGDNNQLPESVELINIYPNPFNGATSILFNIEGNSQEIRLSIYDIQGRQIRNLSSNYLSPDQYLRQWDGRDDGGLNVSSGIYLVRLSTSHSSLARMITYLK
jgi:aminopeptidase N